MRGQFVPAHFAISVGRDEGLALLKLLREVDDDQQFPLGDFEQDVVTDLISILDDEAATELQPA